MRVDNVVFRKMQAGIIAVLMILLLAGCQNEDRVVDVSEDALNSESVTETKEPKYISETSKEDCLLCGDGEGTLLSLYRGEENIGVISLNTFELAHVEINRYDDEGKLIQEASQGSSTRILNTGDDGFHFRVSEDTNRGYARCYLYFNQDTVLNLEKTAENLCTDCLNKAVDDVWGEPTGMAVIDLNTMELRILRENLLSFQFGDFYVSCDAKRDKKDSLEMGLLVFYCPKRYGE